MWRLVAAWERLGSAWSIQMGVYAVAALLIATATVVSVDGALFALGGGVDRHFADSSEGAGLAKRVLETDDGQPRVQSWVLSAPPVHSVPPTAVSRPIESPPKMSRPAQPPSVTTSAGDPRAEWYRGDGGTYTTICVRLCDGFYRPVSYSTTEDRFADDARACQSSCASPSRLYVYPNPGGSVGESEDLHGQPYAKLKTAFLFKTTYVPSCTCQAQPWDEAARDRHRIYALQERAAKGDAKAKAELKKLGPTVAALTKPPGTTMADIPEANGTTFKSRGLASAPSSVRATSQSVASSGWSGSGMMRLGASSPSSSSRSSSGSSSSGSSTKSWGSSSRDSGWRGKAFEAR